MMRHEGNKEKGLCRSMSKFFLFFLVTSATEAASSVALPRTVN